MPTPLITTPFGAQSTAAEVIAGVDLTGKRAIVTGGASGIGLETARALLSAGAEVTLAVRDLEQGRRAADELGATGGEASSSGRGRESGADSTSSSTSTSSSNSNSNSDSSTSSGSVRVGLLDLASQASIAAFVSAWSGPLHILVNNAGVMATPELRTREGWELQFATNHLGHFALTVGLHDALAAAHGARVVVVSSVGHLNGPVLFDDINFEHDPYDPWAAYSQSKTANVLFTVEAANRWKNDAITVNALTPGRIRTGLMRHLDSQPTAPPARFQADNPDIVYKTVEQGAATSVLLAASPLVDGVTGRYFADCAEAAPQQPGIRLGVADYAVDPENARRLWQVSLDLLSATPDPAGEETP
ncbi:SDR family NAD(P)-dependent oxidoreductase [Subtercola lobariae]|uniref:Oxidoreductase n=1 Tax=Subtercola lobariae TaxID=1588641 RepID=A0A917B1J9_9MICO|nr:SDR family NAD(P)-dependent oxidoreductase [Subtercola lobariae]GGF16524.1 oxidoreductase [Subtercola lobariae]